MKVELCSESDINTCFNSFCNIEVWFENKNKKHFTLGIYMYIYTTGLNLVQIYYFIYLNLLTMVAKGLKSRCHRLLVLLLLLTTRT